VGQFSHVTTSSACRDARTESCVAWRLRGLAAWCWGPGLPASLSAESGSAGARAAHGTTAPRRHLCPGHPQGRPSTTQPTQGRAREAPRTAMALPAPPVPPGSSPPTSAALCKQAGAPQISQSHQRAAESFAQPCQGLKPLERSIAPCQPGPPVLPKTTRGVHPHPETTRGWVPSALSKKMLFRNGLLAESAATQRARQAASGTSGGVITVIAEGVNSLPIFSWLHRPRRLKRGRVSAKCYGVKPFSI